MIELVKTMPQANDVIKLLQNFLKETAYAQAEEVINDREHLGKLVFTFMNNGYIWLARQDNRAVGLLMAVVEKNIWAPKYWEMRELVWYVLPEYRQGSIGGRLFKTYCQQGDILKQQGKIQGYFTTRMSTTDDINFEKRGFRLTEQTYLKE